MQYKLYYECFPFSKIPFDNFVADAMIAAHSENWELKPFEDINEVPFSDTTMVVGSVDNTQSYFKQHLGIEIQPIDYRNVLGDFMGRKSEIVNIKDIKAPCFIKPNKIKEFTGFVVTGNPLLDADFNMMTYGYQGDVIMEDVINIVSEYRVYVRRGRIIGVKHYLGDYFEEPLSGNKVKECVSVSDKFNQLSYTLDFGVTAEGKTVLIEANDAWAIGNYGLEPKVYFNFIKERWFQILREKK